MGDAGKAEEAEQGGDELFQARDAADFLGITERRLHQLRRRGQIASVQTGWRRYGFRVSELMAYVERLADQTAQAAAPRTDAEPAPDVPKLREKSPTDEAVQAVSEAMLDVNRERQGKAAEDGLVDAELINQAPIVRMTNAIIVTALESRASDIHLEADRQNLRVRVRIDGLLHELMAIPKHVQTPLLNRYKVMADLAYYKPTPQVGVIPIKHHTKDYDVRVASLPARFGDSLTMRLIDHSMLRHGLHRLGMGAECQARVELLCEERGLLLLAGVPGAGATTTAYTILSWLNDVERKIYTVEAMPGYRLGGVTQTYLRPAKGMTMGTVVENLLEQDPDILFLGDINDSESAEWALRAAEQGAFVIATIAARNVFDGLGPLARLAPPPARAARIVSGVLAQHLVRSVCSECRTEDVSENARLRNDLLSRRHEVVEDVRLMRGAGCEACRKTGYRGRIGVFDLLNPTDELRDLLEQGVSPSVLRANRISGAGVSFRDDLAGKLAEGVTSAEEAWRALRAFGER